MAKQMAKQMEIDDFLPNRIKDSTRVFIEGFYLEGAAENALVECRNRYEGYGLLAAAYVVLCGAMDSVKAGMKDCLKTISSDDAAFLSASDVTYSALVDLAIAATQMGVQNVNVVRQMMDRIQKTPLPLEEYAASLTDEDDLDYAISATEDEQAAAV